MKRGTQTRYVRFSGLKLYLDDYRELVEIMSAQPKGVEITADEFKLEEPEEITKISRVSLRELALHTRSDFDASTGGRTQVRVMVEGGSAAVFTEQPAGGESPLSFRVEQFLRERSSRVRTTWRTFVSTWPLALYVLLTVAALLIIPAEAIRALPPLARLVIVAFVIVGGSFAGHKSFSRSIEERYPALVLTDRPHVKKVLGVDREKLALLLLGSILTLGGQFLVRWILGN